MTRWKTLILGVAVLLCLVVSTQAADKVLARVNGVDITDADLATAETELAEQLASIPPDDRKRVLLEHLIETQLMADAASKEKLDSGPAIESRMKYYRRRALREVYINKKVRESVNDAEAKKFYDQQVAQVPATTEVRARHILVQTEKEARELQERLGRGDDFAALAKEHSKDPGSGQNGGDLGYFAKDQMVQPFGEVAFKMEKGAVSDPVQTQFGWHLIKVEDKRERKPPSYDDIKDQVVAFLVRKREQETSEELRKKGKVEVVDADLKKQMDEAEKAQQQMPKQ